MFKTTFKRNRPQTQTGLKTSLDNNKKSLRHYNNSISAKFSTNKSNPKSNNSSSNSQPNRKSTKRLFHNKSRNSTDRLPKPAKFSISRNSMLSHLMSLKAKKLNKFTLFCILSNSKNRSTSNMPTSSTFKNWKSQFKKPIQKCMILLGKTKS